MIEKRDAALSKERVKKQKKRKLKDDVTRDKFNSNRTVRRRAGNLVDAILKVPPQDFVRVLASKRVVAHMGRDIVMVADYGNHLITKMKENIESIMHAGRWSKEDTVIKDFIVEISSDSSLCTSKNAELLVVDRRTLSNYTRNY